MIRSSTPAAAASIAAVVSGSIRTDGERTISALVVDQAGTVLARYDTPSSIRPDGRRLCGHSAIYDPEGKVLADAGPSEEGLAVADLDPRVLARVRARSPILEEVQELRALARR